MRMLITEASFDAAVDEKVLRESGYSFLADVRSMLEQGEMTGRRLVLTEADQGYIMAEVEKYVYDARAYVERMKKIEDAWKKADFWKMLGAGILLVATLTALGGMFFAAPTALLCGLILSLVGMIPLGVGGYHYETGADWIPRLRGFRDRLVIAESKAEGEAKHKIRQILERAETILARYEKDERAERQAHQRQTSVNTALLLMR